MRLLASFISGALFAIGLALSGMTKPDNVIGFLDFFGNWKGELMFVMGGAVVTLFTIKKLLHLSARVSGASAIHTLVSRIGSSRQLTVHAGVVWSQRHARDKRLVLQELQLIATCIPASLAV